MTCSANPDRLWPANNKLKTIDVAVNVTDDQSGAAGFTLIAVTNDETSSPGDMVGWEIGTPDTAGELMASRAGNGDGRIYTLTYEGMDVAGNTARCSTIVFVPHDSNQPNPPQPIVAADVDVNSGSQAEGDSDIVAPDGNETGAENEGENEDSDQQAEVEAEEKIYLPLLQR